MFTRIPSLSTLALLLLSAGLTFAVPNDQFGAASDLGSVTSASTCLDTRLATRQVGEPAHDNNTSTGSSWWKWIDSLDRLQWAKDHGDGTETFHVLLSNHLYADLPKFFARPHVDLGSDPLDE